MGQENVFCTFCRGGYSDIIEPDATDDQDIKKQWLDVWAEEEYRAQVLSSVLLSPL